MFPRSLNLDRPAPRSLDRWWLLALFVVLLLLNCVLMLTHVTAGGFLVIIMNLSFIAIVGYALWQDLKTSPPTP